MTVLSDSTKLQLQGPHIHFNGHHDTDINTNTHTHTLSLALFPLFDFYPSIFSQPLKARRGSAPPFVFPAHVCVLRALHLLLPPSRFHLFPMLLILFVPTSPAPPSFLTFTLFTSFETVFSRALLMKNVQIHDHICLCTDKVWWGFFVHICSWSPVWASSMLWGHVGSQISHIHTLLIPNNESSRAAWNQQCVCVCVGDNKYPLGNSMANNQDWHAQHVCVRLLGYLFYFSPTDLIKCNHVDYINQEGSDHLFLRSLSSLKPLGLSCLAHSSSLPISRTFFFSQRRLVSRITRTEDHDHDASFQFEWLNIQTCFFFFLLFPSICRTQTWWTRPFSPAGALRCPSKWLPWRPMVRWGKWTSWWPAAPQMWTSSR